MSDVNERRRLRMKHQRLQRHLDRTVECAHSMACGISGMPDIRAEVDDILAPLQPRTRRPLRLTRSRP